MATFRSNTLYFVKDTTYCLGLQCKATDDGDSFWRLEVWRVLAAAVQCVLPIFHRINATRDAAAEE